MESRVLQELKDEAEDLGHKPGTPTFDKVLCKLKVIRCREMQSVSECPHCKAFESCGLINEYYMDIRYPNRRFEGSKNK